MKIDGCRSIKMKRMGDVDLYKKKEDGEISWIVMRVFLKSGFTWAQVVVGE